VTVTDYKVTYAQLFIIKDVSIHEFAFKQFRFNKKGGCIMSVIYEQIPDDKFTEMSKHA